MYHHQQDDQKPNAPLVPNLSISPKELSESTSDRFIWLYIWLSFKRPESMVIYLTFFRRVKILESMIKINNEIKGKPLCIS